MILGILRISKRMILGILRISKHIKNYFTQSIVCQILKTCIIRLSFGDALWHSVLRPAVSHGDSVWFPSPVGHVGSLESIQYKMAKLIMNTRMNIRIYMIIKLQRPREIHTQILIFVHLLYQIRSELLLFISIDPFSNN
jgi:hypothetical protein